MKIPARKNSKRILDQVKTNDPNWVLIDEISEEKMKPNKFSIFKKYD